HWVKRHLRQRVERDEDRLADRPGHSMDPHPHADREPDPVGQHQRVEKTDERRPRVFGKTLARHELGEISQRRYRTWERGGANHLMQRLPCQQQDDQHDQSVGCAFGRDHGLAIPRRSAQRWSTTCSSMLTTVATMINSSINAYICRLLKSV